MATMIPIAAVYPDAFKDGKYDAPYDYGALVGSLGYVILLESHDDDYSGDSFYLLKTWNKGHGFLSFGWGSCSGCDALQGCESLAEVAELREQIDSGIRWFPDLPAMQEYFRTEDLEVKFYSSSGAFLAFRAAVLARTDKR